MGFNPLKKIIGDPNERALNQLRPIVEAVNALEPAIEALDEEQLRAKTDAFRTRLADGESLDELLPEALAVCREAVRRAVGERAYDVQVMGAVALHHGNVAEMRTGEGKTLVATLALYVNALDGQGAHLVTVNDYLAGREPQWYGPALDLLGLRLGVIQHDSAFLYSHEPVSEQPGKEHLLPVSRREAYEADITYGTNNEFGFDYLRDNMVQIEAQRGQRRRHYAIVDEADSVLIDEARTPLIISGQQAEDLSIYPRFSALVPQLARDVHYTIEERTRGVHLTEAGVEALERGLGIDNIFSEENFRLTRYMEAALKAQIIYQRDRDYVVTDGKVVIVDEFTGRLMEGRRWSDGLHQAVEAKEGVRIQQESVTYATITLQNFFRLYEKLAGMTGTAVTDAEEFNEIYGLDVVVIPTHRPMIREDRPDYVYGSQREKFKAVIDEVAEKNELGRPVLVGTVSIEDSEQLSDLLRRRGVDHEVLNAKQHLREAAIIARAGQRGAVTIATNMAGRGTDIKLGEGVADIGGLHIVGTERHESRRVDNQLRGRTGRQGDPGSSRFFVSFEDDIMRRFAPDWLPGMMGKLGMEEGMPLESKMVTRAIETAQSKVESYHFDIRKHVVEYDDVMNQHRDVIYVERDKVLAGESLRETVLGMVEDEIQMLADEHLLEAPADPEAFRLAVEAILPLRDALPAAELEVRPVEDTLEELYELVEARYDELEAETGADVQREIERVVLLRTIDSLWLSHLTAIDELREGIGLRAYGQANPLVAYKAEAHDMWQQLLDNIRSAVARQIYHARVVAQQRPQP
ncbi:MAG: preprotein translocase subunit SecA, partial [Chloroflexi bacterium]|nr:preprotein translocase subunit SecA [Chloroflexota bacterium]